MDKNTMATTEENNVLSNKKLKTYIVQLIQADGTIVHEMRVPAVDTLDAKRIAKTMAINAKIKFVKIRASLKLDEYYRTYRRELKVGERAVSHVPNCSITLSLPIEYGEKVRLLVSYLGTKQSTLLRNWLMIKIDEVMDYHHLRISSTSDKKKGSK